MTTHVEPDLLAAYAGGDVDAAHAYSVEAHVVSCADCQAAIGRLVAPARLQRVWSDVEDVLDAPRAGVLERMLRRLAVGEPTSRLLAATPSLSASWLTAVVLTLAFAALAAQESERGVLLFLCVAALLPAAGVGAAFGRGADPLYEVAMAAPYPSVRLLLLRCATVLPATMALAAVAALTLPGVGWTAAAWLAPSLCLTLMSLALATFVPALRAFITVSATWLAVVGFCALSSGERLAAFDGAAQLIFLVLAACMGALLAIRHDHLDLARTT